MPICFKRCLGCFLVGNYFELEVYSIIKRHFFPTSERESRNFEKLFVRKKQKNRLVPDFSRNYRADFLLIANQEVQFEGVRFTCGPHLVIIHIGKIREPNESYARKMNIVTILVHFCKFTPT